MQKNKVAAAVSLVFFSITAHATGNNSERVEVLEVRGEVQAPVTSLPDVKEGFILAGKKRPLLI